MGANPYQVCRFNAIMYDLEYNATKNKAVKQYSYTALYYTTIG